MKLFFKVLDFLPSHVTGIIQSAWLRTAVDEVTVMIITWA
jgi:hypothetical protein